MNYIEDLKHPKWQRKRLEIMSRDGWKCTVCGDTETELHVHHKKYIPGAKPWEYIPDDIITLCKNCHSGAHKLKIDKELVVRIRREVYEKTKSKYKLPDYDKLWELRR